MKPPRTATTILLSILLTGCITTTSPDGTVTKSPDRALLREAAKTIIILRTK